MANEMANLLRDEPTEVRSETLFWLWCSSCRSEGLAHHGKRRGAEVSLAAVNASRHRLQALAPLSRAHTGSESVGRADKACQEECKGFG